MLFTTTRIGTLDNSKLLSRLVHEPQFTPDLEEVIILYGENDGFRTYDAAVEDGWNIPSHAVAETAASIEVNDTCMLMFTSGSTGNPKAASLTHQ